MASTRMPQTTASLEALEAAIFPTRLSEGTVGQIRIAVTAFAESQEFTRAEYIPAFQEWLADLDRFKARLIERKLTQRTLSKYVGVILTAIDKKPDEAAERAKQAGFTTPNLEPENVQAPPGRLETAIIPPRLSESARLNILAVLKKFAESQEFTRAEYIPAFQEWIDKERDEALADLDRFKARLTERKLALTTVSQYARIIRKAADDAHVARLTSLNLRPVQAPPGRLETAIIPPRMSESTSLNIRCNLERFAESQEFTRAEYIPAFQEWIDKKPDEALADLDRFKARLIERKLTPIVISLYIGMLKSAVRKAKDKGFTALDFGKPRAPTKRVRPPKKLPETSREPARVFALPDGTYKVGGKIKTLRTAQQRSVVGLLVSFGRPGLRLRELQRVCPSAQSVLKNLHDNHEDWQPYIHLAGVKGLLYGIW